MTSLRLDRKICTCFIMRKSNHWPKCTWCKKEFVSFMTFGQSHLTYMKRLENVGMLSTSPIMYEGREIVLIQVSKALLPDPLLWDLARLESNSHRLYFLLERRMEKSKTIYIYTYVIIRKCWQRSGSQAISIHQ